jgi:hypothetical protein
MDEMNEELISQGCLKVACSVIAQCKNVVEDIHWWRFCKNGNFFG